MHPDPLKIDRNLFPISPVSIPQVKVFWCLGMACFNCALEEINQPKNSPFSRTFAHFVSSFQSSTDTDRIQTADLRLRLFNYNAAFAFGFD